MHGINHEAGLISKWEVCCCLLTALSKTKCIIVATAVFVGNFAGDTAQQQAAN